MPSCTSTLSKWAQNNHLLTRQRVPHSKACISCGALGNPGSERRMPYVALLKLTLHIQTHSSSFPECTVPVSPPFSDWFSCVSPLPPLHPLRPPGPPQPQEGKAQSAWLGLGREQVVGLNGVWFRAPAGSQVSRFPFRRALACFCASGFPATRMGSWGTSPALFPSRSHPGGRAGCAACHRFLIATPTTVGRGSRGSFYKPYRNREVCNLHFPTVYTTFAFNLAP